MTPEAKPQDLEAAEEHARKKYPWCPHQADVDAEVMDLNTPTRREAIEDYLAGAAFKEAQFQEERAKGAADSNDPFISVLDPEAILSLLDELKQKEEALRVAKEALEDMITQHKGLKENWCGEWFKCGACGRESAAGGNWTVSYYPAENCKPEDFRCDVCRASKALSEMEGKA